MTQTATTITVDSLPVANSIDASNDRLLIYTASATDIQGINRNTLLGLSSQPMGISDSQVVSNKTLNNTNIVTIQDSNFTLQDNIDTTKQAQFQLSGNTTSTTRTYSLPNASVTLASLTGTETLTNKTLTAPVISGGSIDNSTITVDTIAGHTTAGSVTIGGIAIASSVITTANSIGTGTVVQNGIAASQLATTAITLGYAQITGTFTTSATSATLITGLSVGVTIPTGGRKVEVTVFGRDVFAATSAATVTLYIYSGTTIGALTTLLAQSNYAGVSPTLALPAICMSVQTPSAGAIFYTAAISTSSGSDAANIEAATSQPAFILVKVI